LSPAGTRSLELGRTAGQRASFPEAGASTTEVITGALVTEVITGALVTEVITGALVSAAVAGALVSAAVAGALVSAAVAGALVNAAVAGALVSATVAGALVTDAAQTVHSKHFHFPSTQSHLVFGWTTPNLAPVMLPRPGKAPVTAAHCCSPNMQLYHPAGLIGHLDPSTGATTFAAQVFKRFGVNTER
jgi:hypothetical protein